MALPHLGGAVAIFSEPMIDACGAKIDFLFFSNGTKTNLRFRIRAILFRRKSLKANYSYIKGLKNDLQP